MTPNEEALLIAHELVYRAKYPNVRTQPTDADTWKESATHLRRLVAENEQHLQTNKRLAENLIQEIDEKEALRKAAQGALEALNLAWEHSYTSEDMDEFKAAYDAIHTALGEVK